MTPEHKPVGDAGDSGVRAARLVDALGDALVGRSVLTVAMGEYPGGVAIVTEVRPDPAAPDIAFLVRHPTFGTIGVFDCEQVTLKEEAP